jgi:branched-chain amino acid transport system substrate-binding protein
MLAVEAAKKAQEIHGTGQITAAMMRDGMEALEISGALMEELGLPNFGPEFAVSCDNHGGSGLGIVQQWDAAAGTWNQITDYIAPDAEVLNALIMEDSMAYAAENNIAERCN